VAFYNKKNDKSSHYDINCKAVFFERFIAVTLTVLTIFSRSVDKIRRLVELLYRNKDTLAPFL